MGRWTILSRRASAPEAPEVGDLPVGDAPRSRRDALRLAAVGIAGGVGGAVVSAGPARAADGSNVVVGSRNVSSNNNTVTTVEANGAGAAYALATAPTSTRSRPGCWAWATPASDGLRGVSTGDLGYGVVGSRRHRLRRGRPLLRGHQPLRRRHRPAAAGPLTLDRRAQGRQRLLPRAARLLRDANGEVWICTADGNPGQLAPARRGAGNARGGAHGDAAHPLPAGGHRGQAPRPRTAPRGRAPTARSPPCTATGRSLNGLQRCRGAPTGIVGNLTVTGPSSGGYVSVFPADSGVPNTSNLNFAAGSTIANAVTVGLSERRRSSRSGRRRSPRTCSSTSWATSADPPGPGPAGPKRGAGRGPGRYSEGPPATPSPLEFPRGPRRRLAPHDLDPADRPPRDACGVFGVWAPGEDVAKLSYYGLYALQHRGQEAAGIAVSDGTTVLVYKELGLVAQVFDEATLGSLQGHLAIGHTRYSTTGSGSWENAQPSFRSHPSGSGGLALGPQRQPHQHRRAGRAGPPRQRPRPAGWARPPTAT